VLGWALIFCMQHQERTTRRHPVDLEALVIVPVDPGERACRLRDISIGGGFIELGRLPLGTRINLNFGLPIVREQLSLDAVVHWSTDRGVGVQFEGLRAWEVWVLWRYLEHLAGRATGRRELVGGVGGDEGGPATRVAPLAQAQPGPDADAASWPRRRRVVRAVRSVRARVEHGRLKLDEPVDLPDGTRLAAVVFEDDGSSGDLRAKLLQLLDDRDADPSSSDPVGC